MSNQIKFDMNHAAFARILKSAAMHRVVAAATEQIADNVRSQGITVGAFTGNDQIDLPVKTEVTTTDRAHGSVMINHPAGIAVEAKHGALSKAAAAAGHSVKSKR